MAAAIVNKGCHVCSLNFGKKFAIIPCKGIKYPGFFFLYSGGIRKRNVTQILASLNHGEIKRKSLLSNINFPSKKLSTNAPVVEKDLKDVRKYLQGLLSEDTSLTSKQNEVYMNIVDGLAKARLRGLSADDIEVSMNKEVSPSELYFLGSKLFSLQSVVGEEAACLAIPLFKLAASLGDRDARYTYGQLLLRGTNGVEPDAVQAANLFLDLAQEGHPYAQFALAGLFYTGYGIEQSFEKCYTLYQIAGENGIVQSYNSIGKLYLHGQGVDKDESKAVEYFTKGADAGDVQACMSLGHCYSLGKGVDVDFKKSFDYHLKAAQAGYPAGIYNVGTHYFMGKGVDAELSKAAEYFQKSSDLGFSLADVNLGNMYFQGIGVEENWQKAKELYQRAAAKHKSAQLLLEELEKEEKKMLEEATNK